MIELILINNFMKTTEKNIPINSEIGIPFLPYPYNVVAHKRILEKKSYKIIANELNMSEEQCRVCVYRAKKKLLKLDKMLKDFHGTEEELNKVLGKWFGIHIEDRYVFQPSRI